MKKLLDDKKLHIVAFNYETEKNQTIVTSPEWAMTEKKDGYWLKDKATQTKNVNDYLNRVANPSYETIFELVSFEIK